MDAILTRALCDNRKAIDGTQVTLDSILAVLLRVETLLQENVEQSQTVSAELCEAAHEMGDATWTTVGAPFTTSTPTSCT
jgi:hypothetical protein